MGPLTRTSTTSGPDKAWFYIVLLTIGYVVSRGLAKSGSREHYNGS